MAFSNGFNGDQVSLQYILQTLDAKTYFIPGISCNRDISVTAGGESAYYYTRSSSSVSTGTVGAQIVFSSKGVTRKSIDLTSAITISAVIPNANASTVSGVDVVADKVIQETVTVSNKHNELGVAYLDAAGDADAALTTPLGVHKDIVSDYGYTRGTSAVSLIASVIFKLKKDWITKNKANGLRPTVMLVGGSFLADLKTANLLAYKEFTPGSSVSSSLVGYFDGIAVIECPDLDSSYEAILYNDAAFGTPINVNSLVVSPEAALAGYPGGKAISGELGYGFEVTDASLIAWLTA